MPVYEFFCPRCDSKFELRRSFSDADKGASCPKCQSEGQRIFSPFIAFNRFANVEEGHQPIAGTTSSCSSCTATSCSTCH